MANKTKIQSPAHSKLLKIIGHNLKTLRLENELTQEYIADTIGVNRKVISRMEIGERARIEHIAKVMEFFQIEPIELFEDWENVWEVEE